MNSSIELAKWYAALRELSEDDPVESLRQWHAAFRADARHALLEFHADAFARLCARIAAGSGAAAAAPLVAEGKECLEAALAPHRSPIMPEVPLAPAMAPSMSGGAMTKPPGARFEHTDINDLRAVAASWSATSWGHWLTMGFRQVAANDPYSHLGFPPLRLYPLGNYVPQLADALLALGRRDAGLFDTLLSAIRHRIATGQSEEVGDRQGLNSDDWQFWHLLLELRVDENVTLARRYVNRLCRADGQVPVDVFDPMCRAIWHDPTTESDRAACFERLSATGGAVTQAWLVAALLKEAALDSLHAAGALIAAARDILALGSLAGGALNPTLDAIAGDGLLHDVATAVGQTIGDAAAVHALVVELASRRSLLPKMPPEPTARPVADVERLLMEAA